MEVGGPPWLNGAAVRAGYATVAATTAVVAAWTVARLGQPLLHAVVWPLFGLGLVGVGRLVWNDTEHPDATTVAVAAETMMIVVGVAAAVMGATAALGSPSASNGDRPGSSAPAVLDNRIVPAATSTSTTLADLDQATRTAGAAVGAAVAQLGAVRFGPVIGVAGGLAVTTTAVPSTTTTTVAVETAVTVAPPLEPTTVAATTTTRPGAVRVTTTTRPPTVGPGTSVVRGTSTTRAATTVPPTAAPTTAAPTTPAPTVAPTTAPPTTPAPTTVAPTTLPPTTAAPTTTTVAG